MTDSFSYSPSISERDQTRSTRTYTQLQMYLESDVNISLTFREVINDNAMNRGSRRR